MKLPTLNIGDLIATIPIIQGGMGIGVSGHRLAAAVANQGGVGIISGVQIGFREPDFRKQPLIANIRALVSEIRKARELSPKGIIGVNFLVAMNHYQEMVKAAVEEGIDLIISGAGLPMDLPALVDGFKTKIAPVVSSAKAANVISKLWDRHYKRVPDLVVVEGPEAGGHLGFAADVLRGGKKPELITLVQEVIQAMQPFEQQADMKIPVIAAGGIYTGEDIAQYIKAGAAGVQLATRFVATDECDADTAYKNAYLEAKQEDIVIIDSPVGMPGRALNNSFIKQIASKSQSIKGCYGCLKGCNPTVAPYCISDALVKAVEGAVEEGLVFVGSNAWRLDKIVSVKALMDELVKDAQLALADTF